MTDDHDSGNSDRSGDSSQSSPIDQPQSIPSQPPAAGQFGISDVIVAGPPEPTRRLAPVITSVVAVLAIVLAGGAFTAYKLLASKGDQPDKWVPANSIAYAKIDLDPSASAKVAAWEFERKFPGAPKIASADQLKDALLHEVFADGANVDYDTDVKPWLGNRVAVAAYPDDAGKATVVGIIQVKDTAKARAGLEKVKAKANSATLGYSIQGGYAIVGQNQSSVDAAVAAARTSNITSNHDFASDLAHLKGDRVITAWSDLGATVKVLSTSLPPEAKGLLMSGSLTGLPSTDDLGRVVMGVRVQPSYVELEGRVLGSATDKASKAFANGDARGTLGDLPGGTVMGVALANPEQLIKTELATLSSGLLGAGLQSELDQAGAELGIKLPEDVENLLGSGVALGASTGAAAPGGDASFNHPLFTVLSHPDDVDSALRTAKVLAAAISAQGDVALTATTANSSVVISNDDKPTPGTLADNASFKNALSGTPDKSVVAGFVDLGALVATQGTASADLKHLDGLGFYIGIDSTSPVFGAKLTIK